MTIMIIQFVKGEGLPVVCVATSTCRHDTGRGSQRVKQLVSYDFVCCQENEVIFSSVFSEVITLPSFEMCGYPKNLYILQTESQSMNCFFKKWKVTRCHMIIS